MDNLWIWLVVEPTPLKNIEVSWMIKFSQLNGTCSKMFQTTNQKMVCIRCAIRLDPYPYPEPERDVTSMPCVCLWILERVHWSILRWKFSSPAEPQDEKHQEEKIVSAPWFRGSMHERRDKCVLFLGFREYKIRHSIPQNASNICTGSSLGILPKEIKSWHQRWIFL